MDGCASESVVVSFEPMVEALVWGGGGVISEKHAGVDAPGAVMHARVCVCAHLTVGEQS